MAARTTRFQTANLAASARDLSVNDLITDVPPIVAESSHSSAIVSPVQINVNLPDAQMPDSLPPPEPTSEDEEIEYQRLKRAEEKTIRAQEMQRLRERERQGWVPTMSLPIRNAEAFAVSNPIDADFWHEDWTTRMLIAYSLSLLLHQLSCRCYEQSLVIRL